MEDHITPRRVVIVGGGFAGLFAVRSLRKYPVEIILVDRAGHHLFQPLLYQCATGILSEGQIAVPLRDFFKRQRNVRCVLAEVTGFDPSQRQVLARRPGGERIELSYDDLIVAAGVGQSYFGHDEFARWAPGMKSVADALTIRRRIFGAFELAETATTVADRRRWLTFALVGAGPTGVELAGQLRELATRTLDAEFRSVRSEDARVLLFDGGDAPLATFGPKLSARATRSLQHLGVELHMGARVTKVDQDGLVAVDASGDETRHDAGTVLWTAGVQAPSVADALASATGAERDRAGRILVAPDLTVPGHPDICVVGDLMSLDRLPGVAEVAMQSGLYAARRIKRRLRGDPLKKPFRYHDLGSAAYISRGRAVVSVGRLRFGGFPGWVAWLFIHIAFLTGFRNRVGAILTWSVAFTRDSRRERVFTTRQIEADHDAYSALATGTNRATRP
ncbi:NAD(P)/FAD-dependent oxidoreductase [Saccharomonospora sp. NPDC046836]|uniref:NAD(P)/FAD-dependent oxidoreductase n=1 Tax=Saccharomonospora sp. NPDC046836 TaxID=3156921 RepID=UPI0034037174